MKGEWAEVIELNREQQLALREHAMFHCCKWDPQIEDRSALAPFALRIDEATWRRLSAWAELLADETLQMERAALTQLRLLARLGIPRRARKRLANSSREDADRLRVMRFDFHCAAEGWRITEVNSDVPGGFVETSGIGSFAAQIVGHSRLPGDPAAALAKAFYGRVGAGARVAFVHASAYTDDFQVAEFLSRAFRSVGLRTSLVAPDQVGWTEKTARLRTGESLDGIFRFFPAEWLPNLPPATEWERFFQSDRALQCNPATALISQNKRLPLFWDALGVRCPTWRELLPETRDVRGARADGNWAIKPAFGRVGELVGWEGAVSNSDWRKIQRWSRWFPGSWIAQRRFDSRPLATSAGPRHVCLGVYTIAGKAEGIYGRASQSPIIDYRAQDVPVLLHSSHERN